MTGQFTAYRKYETTGVEWLGDIPRGWQLNDGKRLFLNRRELSLPEDEQLAASQQYGIVPQALMMSMNDAKVMLALKGTSSFRHVEAGDFVISLRSFEGGIEHSAYSGCVSPAYTVLAARKSIASEYYRYLFKSGPFVAALQSTTDSLRDGKSITFGQFGAIPLPIPSFKEQTQIAKFLDYETAKLDALIEKQQQLIALLKEKRQAVISHAVTKGLNPYVPMRDSGVEWLGEVPAHWVTLAVRHAVKIDNGSRLPINRLERADMAGPYPYWGPTGVLDHIDHYRYEGGRAIIGEDGDHFLKFSIWPMTHWVTGKFNVNNHAHVVADGPKCSAKWFYYSFMHRDIGGDVTAQGVARLKLTRDGLSKLVMAVPPPDEQAALIAHMESVIAKVERAAAASEQQVELLQERRAALISAAVTGKIDVRGWKAPESAVEEEVA